MTTATAFGVDAGSTTCKVVAVDAAGEILAFRLEATRPRLEEQAAALVGGLAADLGLPAPPPLVATGYGEAWCATLPAGSPRSLATPGGLPGSGPRRHPGGHRGPGRQGHSPRPTGRPVDFAMNDKCAAGTGRFLEHTAARLGVEVAELGARALAASAEEAISSTCTVFAESEIISLIGRGADLDAIVRACTAPWWAASWPWPAPSAWPPR